MEDFDELVAALLEPGTRGIVHSPETCEELAGKAERSARWIAQNLGRRKELLASTRDGDSIWKGLGELWKALSDGLDPTASIDDHDLAAIVELATALGKLERNLVAGLEDHQSQAMVHEPLIRACIFNVTTFIRIEETQFYTLQAVLTQLLSNIVSPASSTEASQSRANEQLKLYLSGMREDDVIIRLLDSADPKVNISTIHLLSNLIRESPSRQELLFCPVGLQWLSKLLDKMDHWLDAPPEDGRFELSTNLFNAFIHSHLQARLLGELAAPNEPISPSQTTFLKILDSYLANPPRAASSTREEDSVSSPNRFLIPVFQLLSAYATTSIAHVPDDARLPKVFEGLVLVSEALVTIGLGVQASQDSSGGTTEPHVEEELVKELKSPEDGEGLVKPIIETVKALNDFLPRLNPRQASITPIPDHPDIPPDQRRPISQLKRVLIQLLGVLTFNDKAVGDQVRLAGGVQLVLSLTEVDESNPYLREHALFVVRNLMLHNPENQAIIGQMDPVGVLGENGEVLPVPERMKARPNGTK